MANALHSQPLDSLRPTGMWPVGIGIEGDGCGENILGPRFDPRDHYIAHVYRIEELEPKQINMKLGPNLLGLQS